MKARLRLRFICFFIGGLFSFIILMGLFVALCLDVVIPQLSIKESWSNFLSIFIIFIPFVMGGILFGLFFVNPLVHMLSLIRDLSLGKYDIFETNDSLYRTNGKLKRRYFLYRELIADIHILADQLEETKKEREKLEQAKTNWIAGVSHDLKTPLSYITGYSSLLLDAEKRWEQQEQQKFLHEIHDKSVIITDLIGDLNLSFKLDALNDTFPLDIRKFDIVDFAKRILADAASNPTASKYDFGFQSSHDELLINGDEKLLRRAVQNVITNAITHNSPGTLIEIIVNKNSETEQVSLTIKDNGIGMNEETAGNLMKRYYRPKETDNISGGLGLSVVESIIKAHKGTIQIESSIGKGTAITFLLK